MFSKLMKYEWKSYKKSCFILLIAMLFITILGVISIAFLDFNSFTNDDFLLDFFHMSSFIGVFLLYYLGIIACSIAAFIIIAIRFYKSMFTAQGYLTHTLPVSRMQLYGSKLLVAFFYQLYMVILIFFSIAALITMIVYRVAEHHSFVVFFQEMVQQLFSQFSIFQITGTFLLYVAFAIISCLFGIIILFAAITLGQLFSKHRIIGAIIMYLGLMFLSQILFMIVSIFCATIFMTDTLTLHYYNVYYGFSTLLYMGVSVALFFLTKMQLMNNLNLE